MILLNFFIQCDKLVRLFIFRFLSFIRDWIEYIFNIKVAN